MPPPPYIKIDANHYVSPVTVWNLKYLQSKEKLNYVCICTVDEACAEPSCLNVATCVECDPETCPAGGRCRNQRFTKKEYAPVEVRPSALGGYGLVSDTKLVKRQFIIEHIGEVINDEELQRRLQQMKEQNEQDFYFMPLVQGLFIDSKRKSHLSRFINHSCKPNCEARKWIVRNVPVMGIFALQDIEEESTVLRNEELTIDYRWSDFGVDKPCHCGTRNCVPRMTEN